MRAWRARENVGTISWGMWEACEHWRRGGSDIDADGDGDNDDDGSINHHDDVDARFDHIDYDGDRERCKHKQEWYR